MSQIRLFAEKHLDNIRSLFDTLYNDEIMADVTLCCKDGSLKAHKLILAASSPYFKRVFMENHPQQTVFVMHGLCVDQLQNLVELVYRGRVDIPGDTLKSIYDLANDFDIKGVAVDGSTLNITSNGSDSNQNGNPVSDVSNSEGRDTRFKGQKRVAVNFKDYKENSNEDLQNKSQKMNNEQNQCVGNEKRKNNNNNNEKSSKKDGKKSEEKTTSSAWARKLRKFSCSLCPSSFKRASHLTRHQLVHTGERPFACNRCDKAFSRHDKLKHHIKKNHEMEYNPEVEHPLYYTFSHVRVESPAAMDMDQTEENLHERSLPTLNNEKKTSSSSIKRSRGRARHNPLISESTMGPHGVKRENYDITNLPYGDIEYLTKPLVKCEEAEEMIEEDAIIMEPLVEIKTTAAEIQSEGSRTEANAHVDAGSAFLDDILNNKSIAKIGECTISVAAPASSASQR